MGNPLKSALVLGRSGIRCDGGGVGGVKMQRRCHIMLPPDILRRGSWPDHKQAIIGRKKRRMMEEGGAGYPQHPRMLVMQRFKGPGADSWIEIKIIFHHAPDCFYPRFL